MKLSKCEIARTFVNYLGHIIDAAGIHVDPRKVEGVSKVARPEKVVDIQSFLGMCGYYRKFIPRFTEMAKPLFELLSKTKTWEWTIACEQAFQGLKQSLVTAPVLVMPDFTKPFIIQTDASFVGIGAVLCQTHEVDGEMVDKLISYLSR